MHRDTPNNETVIVEYGFIDSPEDDVEQIKKNYKDYAEAVVKSVLDYKGIKYTPPLGSDYYVVKKGDTLWDIANLYGLTVSELKSLNNLNTNLLKIGQTLKVAKKEEEIIPEDYLLYKVKKGDNLSNIAKTYNTTVSTIKKINNLTSDKLTINQQLFLPKNSSTNASKTYVVKKGDTLSEIAYDNNITTQELKDANDLKSDFIKVGQVLVIPSKSSGEINYIVQKGDNLYTIANKYNTSVKDIKNLNDLNTDILQIGQILKIPGSTNYNTYIVKKGDSLWKIANEYGTTVKQLMTINNLSTSNLKIGDSLLIPTN